jgi:hypothetical protein
LDFLRSGSAWRRLNLSFRAWLLIVFMMLPNC